MSKAFLASFLISCSLTGSSVGQSPHAVTKPGSPQLSPKAAYEEAMHPLELTRHSISNWSDIEVGALTVSMANAREACAARNPESFAGADLVDLAKLCALGQNFAAVSDAATRYITTPSDSPKPLLSSAYADLIDAQLHLKQEQAALAAVKAMLAAIPYDTTTAETTDEAIEFMRFVYTPDALSLAVARQPLLLARIRSAANPTSSGSIIAASYPDAEPPQPLHELYGDGVDLAVLQQFLKLPESVAAETMSTLDSSLPSSLSADDAIPIAADRKRFALLGHPLPNLARPVQPTSAKHPVALKSLLLPGVLPHLPANNAITGLLLFPDWCAQCIRMAQKIPQTVFSVEGHEAYLYGLLAETVDPAPAASKAVSPGQFTPADAAKDLADTPTLAVDPSFLQQFAVTDAPFLILTDAHGIIRVLQPVSDDALTPGGVVDSAVARVGATWPLSQPASQPLSTPETAPDAHHQ